MNVIANGDKFWYQNDKLHRLDGPAIERVDGTKYWYLDGIPYTEEEFEAKTNPVKEVTMAELKIKE